MAEVNYKQSEIILTHLPWPDSASNGQTHPLSLSSDRLGASEQLRALWSISRVWLVTCSQLWLLIGQWHFDWVCDGCKSLCWGGSSGDTGGGIQRLMLTHILQSPQTLFHIITITLNFDYHLPTNEEWSPHSLTRINISHIWKTIRRLLQEHLGLQIFADRLATERHAFFLVLRAADFFVLKYKIDPMIWCKQRFFMKSMSSEFRMWLFFCDDT